MSKCVSSDWFSWFGIVGLWSVVCLYGCGGLAWTVYRFSEVIITLSRLDTFLFYCNSIFSDGGSGRVRERGNDKPGI
jgi:hypothetical protein